MEYYYSLSRYFKETFSQSVRKVSLDAGFSCPNRDGTVGYGGCIFCDNVSFSPARRSGLKSIADQIEEGVRKLTARYGKSLYIAYFQPSTNTYAPVDLLERLYNEAIQFPEIVGIAIGTRPDTLPDEVLDLLAQINRKTWLSLEIGLQTSHDSTLQFLHRGHLFDSFLDAVNRAKKRNLRLGTHLILGLPGESRVSVIETANQIAPLGLHSVKLHNLYVVRGTPLADLWTSGQLILPSQEEYAQMVVDLLERLPPNMVIERLSGDAPRDFLLAPEWSGRKNSIQNMILEIFRTRGTRQGSYYQIQG